MTFLFLSEADCVNRFSFGGKLTRLVSFLTLLSLVTSCLCSKFHRLLLLRTIIRHFKNLNLLRVPSAVINPLSVSIQKLGKKRLILDLSHVNQYLFKSKFRCEDVSIAREVLNPGDFMFSFDLKSGYHHVEIFPEHRQYLSFSWNFSSGVTRYFQFSVLPFGLSSAPYLFTKLLKPLVKKWRTEGKSIVVFLDDGLGAAADHTKARILSLSVLIY